MTIVPIGKVVVQEPSRAESRYWTKLNQQLQGVVQGVVSECLEALLMGELDRQLQRKRHQRRAKLWGELRSEMVCGKYKSQQRNNFRRNGSYERGLDTCYGHVRFRMPQVNANVGEACA